jgi:hypothetical protein
MRGFQVLSRELLFSRDLECEASSSLAGEIDFLQVKLPWGIFRAGNHEFAPLQNSKIRAGGGEFLSRNFHSQWISDVCFGTFSLSDLQLCRAIVFLISTLSIEIIILEFVRKIE